MAYWMWSSFDFCFYPSNKQCTPPGIKSITIELRRLQFHQGQILLTAFRIIISLGLEINQHWFIYISYIYVCIYIYIYGSSSNSQQAFTDKIQTLFTHKYVDELMHERRNSSALEMELRLSCINPPIWSKISVPYHYLGLTLMSSWISNQSYCKMWDDITYPFPNFNGATVEVWEWISN